MDIKNEMDIIARVNQTTVKGLLSCRLLLQCITCPAAKGMRNYSIADVCRVITPYRLVRRIPHKPKRGS